MTRITRLATLALFAFLFLGAAPVLAHEGEEGAIIQVEPASVIAGGTSVLAGSGLEPGMERVLVLAGEDLIVELGSVTTDAEGMFQVELTIPAHLPGGTYELRAIGDETLTTPLAITAAAAPDASPGAEAASESIVARNRSPLELGLLAALVAITLAAGVFLVWRAEYFRGEARG